MAKFWFSLVFSSLVVLHASLPFESIMSFLSLHIYFVFSCKVPMSNPENLRRVRTDRDYISKLPDNVLCLILSFLPTKTAVKTSILSKRWRYLWTKVPALDFTEKHSYDMKTLFYSELSLERKIAFNSFVDRVLFHNDISCLQHFWLVLQDADEFYVHSWMNALTRRNIRELNIILNWASPISPSPRLHVSGEKLVVLKLEGEITLSASMFTHLPKIETIHLVMITFSEDSAHLRRPLSNCPVIKELGIIRCAGLPKLVYVKSLTLKSLTITQTRYDGAISAARFVIKTPNVRFLHLDGKLSQYGVLGKTCSLTKANLYVEYDDNLFDNARAQTLLNKVSGVITLKIDSEIFLKERNFPFFQNLTCLEQDGDAVLSQILQCAPKLKSLVIRYFNPESIFNPEVAPKHLPCLERVEVLWIKVEEIIRVLGYILKAASALKEIKIKIRNCSVDEEMLVYQGLLRLPRTSPVCQINVV